MKFFPFCITLILISLLKPIGFENKNELTIVFSHLIQGQLYPCGCNPDSLYGGVAKRTKIINDLRQANAALIVDAGDMLFKKARIERADRDRWAIDADLILYSYKLMGCDALNIGEKDLGYDLSFILNKKEQYNLPLISASIMQNEHHIFDPYIIKEIDSLRIGIFGLTQLTEQQELEFKLTTLDPVIATRNILAELKQKKCNLIILLSDLENNALGSVLDQFHSDIDFVISGHFLNRLKPNQEFYKTTVIVKSGERGQELGYLTIKTDHNNSWTYKSIKIDDELPDDPTVLELLEKARDDALEWEDENIVSMPVDYATYLGCIGCHQPQYEQWKKTRHAHAIEILAHQEEAGNRDCVPCHSVGFKLPGGFISPSQVGILANVQCESCHGMAKWHVLQQGKVYTNSTVTFMWRQNESYDQSLKGQVLWEAKDLGDTLRFAEHRLVRKEVPEEICLTCHIGQHTKPFSYIERLSKGDCLPD